MAKKGSKKRVSNTRRRAGGDAKVLPLPGERTAICGIVLTDGSFALDVVTHRMLRNSNPRANSCIICHEEDVAEYPEDRMTFTDFFRECLEDPDAAVTRSVTVLHHKNTDMLFYDALERIVQRVLYITDAEGYRVLVGDKNRVFDVAFSGA